MVCMHACTCSTLRGTQAWIGFKDTRALSCPASVRVGWTAKHCSSLRRLPVGPHSSAKSVTSRKTPSVLCRTVLCCAGCRLWSVLELRTRWCVCFVLLTSLANGSLRSSRSVLFWYLRISSSARVPGLYRFFSAVARRGMQSSTHEAYVARYLWFCRTPGYCC